MTNKNKTEKSTEMNRKRSGIYSEVKRKTIGNLLYNIIRKKNSDLFNSTLCLVTFYKKLDMIIYEKRDNYESRTNRKIYC